MIRVHGRLFSVKDKCLLYNGWIRGAIHANGLVYLPFLKKGEIEDIQSAMNSGIRAVLGLRRFGYAGISNLRKKLQIPSISEISTYVVSKAAWERRQTFQSEEPSGPMTRSRSKMNLPQKDERGWNGKITSTVLTKAWNSLSLELKTCNSIEQLKKKLKLNIFKFD